MGVLNNIKTELVILLIITLYIFFSIDFDVGINNHLNNLKENHNIKYLFQFFSDITELGDSLWYFGICMVGIILFFIIKKSKIIDNKISQKYINFFFTSFIYLLVVGVITQFFKHLIGRPRPNHLDLDNSLEFYFFSFESNYHSFPSGHSSTIFMVGLILAAQFPRLKFFFYFLATVIAVSRVVVGAHFFTDVIAGALLSLIIFKILNMRFGKKYMLDFHIVNIINKNRNIFEILICFLLLCLFVTVAPSLDLYLASIFNIGGSQFILQSFHILSIFFRKILLPGILIYLLIFPILSRVSIIKIIFISYKFSIKEIFLIWFSQIFTVVIFVNLVLKNLWGRARPGDIIQFDGQDLYTPWYQISNICETNCSFVSGDSSVGFSIIILFLITKKILFLYLSIFLGFSLGLIRMMAGGHFFSDVLFAGFFVIILNLIIYQLYKKFYEN